MFVNENVNEKLRIEIAFTFTCDVHEDGSP